MSNNTDYDMVFSAIDSLKRNYGMVHPYLTMVLCFFSILMNAVSIVVLTRRSMVVSLINCILAYIAFCDILTTTSLFFFMLRVVTFSNCQSKFTYAWIVTLLVHSNLSVICHTTSIWLTVAMAVVRTITIRSMSTPTNQSALSSGRKVDRRPMIQATVMALLVTFAVGLLNLPSMLSFVAVKTTCEKSCGRTNETCPSNELAGENEDSTGLSSVKLYTAAPRDDTFMLNAAFWITGLIFKMIPCILLTIFIVVLMRILAEVKRRRERLRRRSVGETPWSDRTTLMLIVLLSVFLASELPQSLLLIFSGLSTTFQAKIYQKLGDLMDLLSVINSAANFVIYFLMSEKFRQVFCSTVLPRRSYEIIFENRPLTCMNAMELSNCPTKGRPRMDRGSTSVGYNQLTAITCNNRCTGGQS